MLKNLRSGFTLVELLIVIVVIAVLASISTVAFAGVQDRARSTKVLSDIQSAYRQVEALNALNGEYPKTQSAPMSAGNGVSQVTYADINCPIVPSGPSMIKSKNWIPGATDELPQSEGNSSYGAKSNGTSSSNGGCYLYQSDGKSYMISAWNMLRTPQTTTFYKRIGFRETVFKDQFPICNQINIGGNYGNTYDVNEDFYKYSYTITNLSGCNETPPTGA